MPRNGSPGLVRICAASMVGVKVEMGADALEAAASARNAPACTETKHGPEPAGLIAAVEAALHELAGEDGSVADGDYVADEHLAQARGESRRKVAHLVGVRKDDVCGTLGLDELLQSRHIIRRQCIAPAADARCERLCGESPLVAASAARASVLRADDDCGHACAGMRASRCAAAAASQLTRLICRRGLPRTNKTPLIAPAPRT